jgi:ubiquinone/menaquinone biosynthesis C-methylase UbiE
MQNPKIDYSKRGIEERKKKMLDLFLASGNNNIIDLGCGCANYSSLLAKKSKFVLCIDLSSNLCKITNELGFDVIRADGMHLPLKDKLFDALWASEVIEHLPSLESFGEFERVVKKYVIATTPNPSGPNFKADPTHILKFTISGLKKYLKNRTQWNYRVIGIGVEWPAAPYGIKIPKFLVLASFYFTLDLPWTAPTVGIVGKKIGPTKRN